MFSPDTPVPPHSAPTARSAGLSPILRLWGLFTPKHRSDIIVRNGVRFAQGGAMQQIAEWLKKLGMSEYAQAFAENRIHFSVLPDLTDQDLKDIGVVPGDRRKILCAIGRLDAVPKAVVLRGGP